MTIKEHIDVLKELYYRGVPSDDRRFPDKFFSRILYAVRNRLIKERLAKGESISDDVYTTICVDLANSPFHVCNCAEGNCIYKKSIAQIPTVLASKKGMVLNVLNLNGETISQTGVDTNNYAKKYRLNNLSDLDITWFYQNRNIFVLNGPRIAKVLVKAIFTGDTSNIELCSGTGDICVISSDSLIPADMEPLLWSMSLELISNRLQRSQDKANDNNDSTEVVAESGKN
jgi:hypothetical protein